MNSKIKVGIIGGAGYTAGELIRILLQHPATEIIFVHSKSNGDQLLSKVHDDLIGDTVLKFSSTIPALTPGSIDVLFLCQGHGASKAFLEAQSVDASIRIIDLSQDFRLTDLSVMGTRTFVYGLPELNRDAIRTAKNIANPGCFATAIQLGLLPLAAAGLLKTVHTTGITGATGAGQSPSATTHFSWRVNNIQTYKTLTHQHLHEIKQSLAQLQQGYASADDKGAVNFVPWRGDFPRGIFISSQIHYALDITELEKLYADFYNDHPFVMMSHEPIHLKQVVNTNKCLIQLEKEGDTLVVHSVIDNLVKGASGQAVQNMNLMFGLAETTGLQLKANYF